MPYFIFKDDGDCVEDITFWDRRKKKWVSDLTKTCIYPSRKGVDRVAKGLFNSYTDHFRPGEDWLGYHCLADFARADYRKIRIRLS